MIRDDKTESQEVETSSAQEHSAQQQRCLINICGRKKREYRRFLNAAPADQRQEYEFISLNERYMDVDMWPPDCECKN